MSFFKPVVKMFLRPSTNTTETAKFILGLTYDLWLHARLHAKQKFLMVSRKIFGYFVSTRFDEFCGNEFITLTPAYVYSLDIPGTTFHLPTDTSSTGYL
jgi:hypothetical protein